MASQVNYNNPAAFQPNLDLVDKGFLGGLQYANQMNDYSKMMQVQHLLQNLAAQRAQMEHDEFAAGAPVRQLEQDAKAATLRGQLPHLEDLAGATAMASRAEQDFRRDVMFGPEAKKEAFSAIREKMDDRQWKQFQREIQAGALVAQQAMDIQKQQGTLAAQAYVKQRKESLSRAGITLPEDLDDPKGWRSFYETAKDSIKHIQDMELARLRNKGALDVANVHAGATRDAAQARANDPRNTNLDQELVNLSRIVASGNASEADKQRLRAFASLKWQKIVSENGQLWALTIQAANTKNPEQARLAQQILNQEYQKFLRMWGVAEDPGNSRPQPQPSPAPQRDGPTIDFNEWGRK